MKSLAEQMSIYQRYHTKAITKRTHFVGVPCLIFAIFMILYYLPLQSFISLMIGILLLYYIVLDFLIGIATGVFLIFTLYAAQWLTQNCSTSLSIMVALLFFTIGWIAQVIGHYHEQKKPAFMDNFFQVFVAPIFLIAEIFFMFGYKKELQREVVTLSEE